MDISTAKHAFITGGASGLGLGMADALLARGVPVTIADIDAEAIAEVLASRGNSFRGCLLDVRDRDAWAKAKAEAEAAFGPVDVLILNAGISPNGRPFAEMDPESFDRILAINLGGVANGIFAFAADLHARGRGHIVLTAGCMPKLAAEFIGSKDAKALDPKCLDAMPVIPAFLNANGWSP